VSTSAASHLPPAIPARAPWGTAGALRAWQQAGLTEWFTTRPRDYLAVATPGAGKTAFALQVAAHPMLHRARTQSRKTLVVLDEIHHAGMP
jgi:superfamily II DNA or RNA helicase